MKYSKSKLCILDTLQNADIPKLKNTVCRRLVRQEFTDVSEEPASV
jgi:hypothetical protein